MQSPVREHALAPSSNPAWYARQRPMWLAAAAIATLYMGSTVLTPLYPIYMREFRISQLAITEIYAVYVLGNLAVLFLFGRLSDQIGRRSATIGALVIAVLSALCFLCATNSTWLAVARVLSGLAAGLGAGALTAWIAELEPTRNKSRAAVVASAGNLAGLAVGAVAAGLLACCAPWPLRTSFVVYIVLLGIVIVNLRSSPETVERPARTFPELSLRPRIGVPRGLRLAFVAPAALAFASFALGGFYAALTPSLLTRIGQTNVAVVGAVVALFFGTAALTVVATHGMKNRTTLLSAVATLLAGLALLALSDTRRSISMLVAASVVSGSAVALGYRGSLQIVNEMAPSDRRAELVSSYLLVCYTANSLPVVGVGVLSQALGAQAAHRLFSFVLATLALVAAALGRTRRFSAS